MTEYYPPATHTGHVPAPVYGQGGGRVGVGVVVDVVVVIVRPHDV